MDQLRLFPRDERLPVLVLDRRRSDSTELRRRLRRCARLDATSVTPSDLRPGGAGWPDGTRPACAVAAVAAHPAAAAAIRRWTDRLAGVPLVVVADGDSDFALAALDAGAEEVVEASAATGPALERAVLAAVTRRRAEEVRAGRGRVTDTLTGLQTRDRLDAELPRLLRETRTGRSEIAVLYADLDRFKAVNDSLGHAAGDEVLVEAAERLRSAVRGSDLVVRLGGDEFVVVVGGPAAVAAAEDVAERLVRTFAAPFRAGGRTVRIGISVGLAVAEPGEPSTDLLARADRALYRAKQRGRHRVARWDTDVAPAAAREATLQTRLREGIVDDRLALVARPVADRATGRVLGHLFESDWGGLDLPAVGPRRGPAAVAADGGDAAALFRWSSLRLARVLAERSPVGPSRAFLAMPASELAASPARMLGPLLETASVDPCRIVVLLDESALVDPESVRPGILELARSGLRLAVSGFGRVHGSLGLLERHPFDSVWLDRQGVDGLAGCPVRRARLRAVVEVAASLGQQVVADAPLRPDDAAALDDIGGIAVVSPTIDLERPVVPLPVGSLRA
jgi:diguanylate cyclase (GGDEF)-like protein